MTLPDVGARSYPAEMNHEVTVGQAAKMAGVPIDLLRDLCDDGTIGATRRSGGHWYLPVNEIPDRAYVRQALLRQYRTRLAAAQAAGRRLQAEVEAIQLDLAEAAEDEDVIQVLGNDVSAAADNRGALTDAIRALREASLWVHILHRKLRLLEEHGAADV